MKDSVIDLRKEEKKRARKKIPVACAQRNRFIPGFMIACALLSILSLLYLDIDWLKLLSRTPEIGGVFWELLQFDFSSMDVIGSSLLETVSIAVLSLLYSLVLGVIFGMLAARNILRLPWLSGNGIPAGSRTRSFFRPISPISDRSSGRMWSCREQSFASPRAK